MDAGRPRHVRRAGGWGRGGRAAGAHAGGADARAAAVGVGGAGVGAGAAVVGVGLQVGAEGAAAGLALGERSAEAGGDAVAGHALRRLRAPACAAARQARAAMRVLDAGQEQAAGQNQGRTLHGPWQRPNHALRGAGAYGPRTLPSCGRAAQGRQRARHACSETVPRVGQPGWGRRPGRLPPMRSSVGAWDPHAAEPWLAAALAGERSAGGHTAERSWRCSGPAPGAPAAALV